MLLRITSKRQITFPVRVLDAMGAKPGDQLELTQSGNGYIIRPKRIDYSRLGTLRDKIPPGHPTFDIGRSREQAYDPALRD